MPAKDATTVTIAGSLIFQTIFVSAVQNRCTQDNTMLLASITAPQPPCQVWYISCHRKKKKKIQWRSLQQVVTSSHLFGDAHDMLADVHETTEHTPIHSKQTKKFVSARISFLSHKHRGGGGREREKKPQSSQGGRSAKSAWATRKRPAQQSGPRSGGGGKQTWPAFLRGSR